MLLSLQAVLQAAAEGYKKKECSRWLGTTSHGSPPSQIRFYKLAYNVVGMGSHLRQGL